MFRKLVLIVFMAGTFQPVLGQSDSDGRESKRRGRPDIPGTFLIDFGFNLPSKDTVNFNTGVWGSRTVNIYYQLDKRFGQSKFSVHPGIGFGLERFKFNNLRTLNYIAGPDGPFDTLRMVPLSSVLLPGTNVKKSQLINNYLDVILELKFSSNPNDPSRSFRAALGFKGGVLIDAYTKLKYREDGENKKFKNKQDWNINPFRYGATVRIGVANFNAFAYYSLSPIFKDGKGPDGAEINNFTVGISMGGF